MSDFLSNLAARSLIPAADIQPRRAARFEPRPTAAPPLDSPPIELELEHASPEQPRPSEGRADRDPAQAARSQRGHDHNSTVLPRAADAERPALPNQDAPERRLSTLRSDTAFSPHAQTAEPPSASERATPAVLHQAAAPRPPHALTESPAAQPRRPATSVQPISRIEPLSRPTVTTSRAADPAERPDRSGQAERESNRAGRSFASAETSASVAQQPPAPAVPRPPADRAADESPDRPSRSSVTPRAEPIQPQITRYVAPPAPPTPTPPPIQVTIGRIEVRATPAAPKATSTQRSGPAVMTIEEYLRQRSEGGSR